METTNITKTTNTPKTPNTNQTKVEVSTEVTIPAVEKREKAPLRDWQKSPEQLEEELGITLHFVEHLDRKGEEDAYYAVANSKKLNVTRQYRFRDIGKITPDFMAQGIKMDEGKCNNLIKKVTDDIPKRLRGRFHTHVGWDKFKGTEVFKYREVASKDGSIVSEYKGNLPLEPAGLLEDYINSIKKLVVPHNKLMIVYLAGASGMVTQQLKLPDSNIMLNIYGESGCGKTTAENIAMSFWGSPMELETSFNSTINRTEQIMTERYILPVLIDDILAGNIYSTERIKQKTISDQIFRFSTGRLKGRFNSREERYFGATLVSAETSLFNKLFGSEADGQFYRMIELHVRKGELTEDASHARALDRLARRNYGLGAPALGEYMVKHGYVGNRLLDLYEEQYECLADDDRLTKHQRAANRLAIIMLTAKLMNECFNLGIDTEGIKDILVDSMVETFDAADLKIKAYKELGRLLNNSSNREMFTTSRETYDSTKHLGVLQKNVYGNYELIVETYRMAPIIKGVEPKQIIANTGNQKAKQPIDREIQDILRCWREHGWLDCCGSNSRFYKKLKLGDSGADRKQKLVYVVVFTDGIKEVDNHEN